MLLFRVQKSANTETDQSHDRTPNYCNIPPEAQTGSHTYSTTSLKEYAAQLKDSPPARARLDEENTPSPNPGS